jgi:ribulose-5-phosphate 4-epimerase/fuculose-1-phosphate aldolase
MDTIETLNDYIDGHFNGMKTEREAMLAFSSYRDDVLASIPKMDAEFIQQQPACVAMGFLGKLEFKEGAHLKAFLAQPDLTTLAKLREHGVVAVADTARPAWSHLVTTNETAACNVLSLCAQARKHVRVLALKPKAKKLAEAQ